MASFLAELRRRNIFRVAAAYAFASWILIEAGSVLMPTFGLPEWLFRAYVLLVMAGFVIAVVLAWIFDVTPEGFKRPEEVKGTASVSARKGRRQNIVIIMLLIAALAISVTLNVTGLRQPAEPAADISRQSIAVLPFTSRSTDPENALFTDGIHDDLLTSLANIAALKVISRTSVMEYRDTTKNLRQIASELGVGTVLEGAVQRAGDAVRINVQLIDARTDEHLWARSYDRELTTQNIFAIQSEISEAISRALKAELSPMEQGRLAAVPTENLEAYRLYAAGRNNIYLRRMETMLQARKQFEQAIAQDPDYAQAYSGLADSVLLLLINHNLINTDEAHRLAQDALDKALALDPELADAYASLGLLEMDRWQATRIGSGNQRSEAAFLRAIELNPNHARAHMWFASLRAVEQRFAEAIELYHRSLELDPLARVPYANLPGLYAQMGRNQEALEQWLEAVDIHPEWRTSYDNLAAHLERLGRYDESLAWAVRARELSTDPFAGGNMVGVYWEFGDVDRAVAFLDGLPPQHPFFGIAQGFREVLTGNYADAVELLEQAIAGEPSPREFVLDTVSDAATLLGDLDKAREYCLRRDPELAQAAEPRIDRFNADNVIKFAYLLQQQGENERADRLLAAALPVVRSLPRLGTAGHGIRDVQILALQGREQEALATLREAIDTGFRGSLAFDRWSLEQDPYLVSIRNHPEFQAMRAEIDAAVAVMRERAIAAEANNDWEALRALAAD